MNDRVEFEVGKTYENMKGPFTVLSIKGDEMTIRWDHGEQISTSVDLQRRIIERMEDEKEKAAKAKQKAKSGAGRSQRSAKAFPGFQEDDFKDVVGGTVWRNRQNIGGAVTSRLASDRFRFNSWAASKIPLVAWLDGRLKDGADESTLAKFFAKVDTSTLSYGFYIEHPEGSGASDWEPFLAWLSDGENEAWLLEICVEHDLVVRDMSATGFNGVLRPEGEGWSLERPDGESEAVASLSEFLKKIPEDRRADLQIARILEKAEAVEKGAAIAEEMAALFNKMMPLYAASARS